MRRFTLGPSARPWAVAVGLGGALAIVPALGLGADSFTVYRLTSSTDSFGLVPVAGGPAQRYLVTTYAEPTTLSGRIGFIPSGRGLHNATVELSSPSGSVVASKPTNGVGGFGMTWKPFEAGKYSISVKGLNSDPFPVQVRLGPRVQLLRPRRVAGPGQSLTVRGYVRPRGAGVTRAVVQYQQRKSGGWQSLANGPVGPDGSFAINYRAPRSTEEFDVRVRIPPQGSWTAGASGFLLSVR